MQARRPSPSGDADAPSPPVCTVERWRGYVACSFVLRTPAGEVFESPTFRWRRAADPPDEGDARAAYDQLMVQLADAGWTTLGHNGSWYAAQVTHPALRVARAAPVQEPPPEPAAAPAPVPAAPPVVVRQAPPPPPTPAAAPSARRSRRGLVLAVAAGAAFAAAAAVLLVGHGSSPAARTPAHPRYRPPAVAPPVVQAPAPKPPRRLVHLTVAAAESSWLEVRRGSSTGRVLFSGVLDGGRSVRFSEPRLWARFGAAGNLRITQDGRAVPLQGTYDKVFRPR